MGLDAAYVRRVGPLFTFSPHATPWDHVRKSSSEKIRTPIKWRCDAMRPRNVRGVGSDCNRIGIPPCGPGRRPRAVVGPAVARRTGSDVGAPSTRHVAPRASHAGEATGEVRPVAGHAVGEA